MPYEQLYDGGVEIQTLHNTIDSLEKQLKKANRKIRNLERDNAFLATANENAEILRDAYENELLITKQKAEEASSAKSAFLAHMSHEMRTPMNAIKVLSELLLRTNLDRLQADYAKTIVNSTSTLLKMINDILDFSKLDANKFELVAAPYDFASLLDDVCNIINMRASDKKIVFITDIDKDIPVLMHGDDLRIKQVLLNILSNAVKFTTEGYIKLTVKPEHTAEDVMITLSFVVEDTGIGIDEEDIHKLFEPFVQLDVMRNRKNEGSGLGLSITKGLISLLGGDIRVESQYGKGSKFIFTIPQLIIDKTPLAHVPDSQCKRVLLAGDSMQINACAHMLNHMSIQYDLATTEALFGKHLSENSYSHVLYYFSKFHQSVLENEPLLENCNLVAIKDIRFAGNQQTRENIRVLFEPVLIHEMAKIFNQDEPLEQSVQSDAEAIGIFSVKDVSALIVDDNEINLIVMEQLLKEYNIDSVAVEDGFTAIEMSHTQEFDIIFMDHMMPIMNGIEASKKIHQPGNPNASTPVIVVTANALTGAKDEFLKEGMNGYISKPIDIKELNRVLKKWLPAGKIFERREKGESNNLPMMMFMQNLTGLGVDCFAVIQAMGYTEDTYMKVIYTFVDSIPGILNHLAANLQQQDLDLFRINIHGVKSALANIGAEQYAEIANKMELAAMKEDCTYIEQHFQFFYEQIMDLIGDIVAVKPRGSQDDIGPKILFSKDEIQQILMNTVGLLDGLDNIQALENISHLIGHVDDTIKEPLNDIKRHIENFDYDLAAEQIACYTNSIM